MKKAVSWLLVLVFCTFILASSALAYTVGEKRVTLGANLTDEQKAQIYRDFNIAEGDVKALTITNADEKAYLANLVPEGKIGNVALSSIYIETLEPNSGLTVETKNINWATADMYKNALITAGIVDAKIIVSAPFPVSGTAALTGVYKAYEDITGTSLASIAKTAGIEELLVTGELAEYIGSDDATAMLNELKKILDQTQNMPDDEVRKEIRNIAKAYNVSLTDAQVEQLLALCRSLEKLDAEALRQRLLTITNTMKTAKTVGNVVSDVVESVKNFFVSVGDFFARLFGGKK